MAKHKYIESPEAMLKLFELYKTEVKAAPILEHDFVGKNAESVHREKERPLTLEGFNNWLWNNTESKGANQYFKNQDEDYTEYLPICSYIREVIRQDQIEGGMAGIYNPSITQRLNGLREGMDVGISKTNYPPWMDEGES